MCDGVSDWFYTICNGDEHTWQVPESTNGQETSERAPADYVVRPAAKVVHRLAVGIVQHDLGGDEPRDDRKVIAVRGPLEEGK